MRHHGLRDSTIQLRCQIRRSRRWMMFTLLSLFSLISFAAFAEVIHIPVGSQNPQAATMKRPAMGMLRDQVMAEFGQPVSRHPAVGNPPIERWDYDQFSVYFEYDHVVHSVLKGPAPPP